jgi:hypothetical protein
MLVKNVIMYEIQMWIKHSNQHMTKNAVNLLLKHLHNDYTRERIFFLCFFVYVYSDKKEHRIAVEDVKNIYVCKPAPFSVIEKIWVSHLSIMKCDDSLLPIRILQKFPNGTEEYVRTYLSDRNGCL